MKLSKMGLIALAAAILLSPAAAFAQAKPVKINEKNHKQGQAEAPALVAAGGIACNVSDALFIGKNDDAKAKTSTSFYELACTGSIGRVLQVISSTDKKAAPPIAPKYAAFDCISMGKPLPDGKPNSLACVLPANESAAAGIAGFVTKAGINCTPANARAIGSSAENAFFEVACTNKRGYILTASSTLDATKEVAPSNCLLYKPGGSITCELSQPEEQLTVANTLAATADAACQVKDRRYVLSTVSGDEWYEISCASGTGFMLSADAKGVFKTKIDCANAEQLAGGCQLTDVNTAKTEDNALYTRLAKAAGFNCDVAKYRTLGADANGETVELACANRADGALAVLPKAGGGRFYNCAASQTAGYRCNLTTPDAAYALLTAAVKKARPTSTCVVSGANFLGVNTEAGFVEVACADKEPGYVLRYLKTTDVPSDAYYCTQAKTVIGVTCALPTNITKAG